MSSEQLPPSPSGVSGRRKGKPLRLPESAFSPTGEAFPGGVGAEVPGTVHPDSVVDGQVNAPDGLLSEWTKQAGLSLGKRIGGIVVNLKGTPKDEMHRAITAVKGSPIPVLSIAVPFELEDAPPSEAPAAGTSLSTVYSGYTEAALSSLKWALNSGVPLDIEVKGEMTEGLEDLLTKGLTDIQTVNPIILSNILPPPHDLSLPIVKLLNDPSYMTFQAHTASLSLLSPNLFVKFLPPVWNASTPVLSSPEAKEWKRRINMYLGPVLEAYGYERIIFGSSTSGEVASNASDWYELAREALAELGVDQEAIDAVFSKNAKKAYSSVSV